jgi:hypothetical protein
LDRNRELPVIRLTYKQVNVFGHYDVAADAKLVPDSNLFESLFEHSTGIGRAEKWSALVATEGNEVKIPGFLVTPKAPRHVRSIIRDSNEVGDG